MMLSTLPVLSVAPARVMRGAGILAALGPVISELGRRPLVVAGAHTLPLARLHLEPALEALDSAEAVYSPDCSEATLARLTQAIADHNADLVIGVVKPWMQLNC